MLYNDSYIVGILSSILILILIETSHAPAVPAVKRIQNLKWKSVENSFIAADAFSKFMENTL